jgi:hypothetical protein
LNELSGYLTGTANKEIAKKCFPKSKDFDQGFVQMKISTADAE